MRDTVLAYWAAADAGDWPAFGALLADDIVYHLPQTGERVRGRAAYLRFNEEYPGDWHMAVERVVVEGRQAVSWARFTVDDSEQAAVTFFDFDDDGRIAAVTDFWPDPYEPPPGREHLVER
jgi:ketosteroid isomerase-like protein